MARLGRGRREGARITKARSAPTATPLVKAHVVQTPNGNRRRHIVSAFFRRHRARIVLRAPLPPPVTSTRRPPIVSRNRRAAVVRALVRDRVRIVRSFVPSVRARPPLVRPFRPAARVRFTRGRGNSIVIRAASIPTATPLVRKRAVVETTTLARTRTVARLRHRQARIVRSPMPQPAPFARPRVIVAGRKSRRVNYVRSHQRRPILLRAPLFATQTRPPLVIRRKRQAVVARLRRRDPLVLRSPLATPTPLVRRRLVLETQTGNRPRVVARVRHRPGLVLRSRGGTAAVITGPAVIGQFDAAGTHGITGGGSPVAGGFDGAIPGEATGASSPAAGRFGSGRPRQS